MVVDSLPDRPLQRSEVDALESSDSIHATFPVYGERPEMRDTAYGVVIVTNRTAHAVVYDGDEWAKLDSEPVDTRTDGIAWDDRDTIDELQASITGQLQ